MSRKPVTTKEEALRLITAQQEAARAILPAVRELLHKMEAVPTVLQGEPGEPFSNTPLVEAREHVRAALMTLRRLEALGEPQESYVAQVAQGGHGLNEAGQLL
jgi:hypothetical protein